MCNILDSSSIQPFFSFVSESSSSLSYQLWHCQIERWHIPKKKNHSQIWCASVGRSVRWLVTTLENWHKQMDKNIKNFSFFYCLPLSGCVFFWLLLLLCQVEKNEYYLAIYNSDIQMLALNFISSFFSLVQNYISLSLSFSLCCYIQEMSHQNCISKSNSSLFLSSRSNNCERLTNAN